MKGKRGITLIALVVTIIVLIILAGVSINLVLGDNGIITKAKQAKTTYSQAQAREKLEMVLAELQADKAMDPEYDQEDYINKKIEDNDMEVEGDIVIVDGWQFEIDRNVPEIVNELSKLTEEEMLKPIITKVRIQKGLNEITVEIGVRNKENTTISYEIRKQGEEEGIEKIEGVTDLQHTFENLERGEKYIITIVTTNAYGTSTKRVEATTEIDTTKPEVTILEMEEKGKITEEFVVKYKLSDNIEIDIENCKYFYDESNEAYQIDNEVWNSANMLEEMEGEIIHNFEQEGNYYLHILATDTSGNYLSYVSRKVEVFTEKLYLYNPLQPELDSLNITWVPDEARNTAIDMSGDVIFISAINAGYSEAWVHSSESIELSEYSFLCAEVEVATSPYDFRKWYLEVADDLENPTVDVYSDWFQGLNTSGIIRLDISDLEGRFHVLAGMAQYNYGSIHKIWLEK